jgi:hypothetical protein
VSAVAHLELPAGDRSSVLMSSVALLEWVAAGLRQDLTP